MELNQLIFNAKLRSSWQVYDLTLLMLKQFGLKIFFIWALIAVPVAALAAVIFDPAIAMYIVWWLKPVFERPLLHYYSRAVFAQPVTIMQALRSLPGMPRRDWLRILTWHRLRWRRAYLAPVDQLEQLSGQARQQREQALLRFNQDQQGFWVLFCAHLECLIMLVAFSLLWAMLPQGVSADWEIILEQPPQWLSLLTLVFYVLAACLVAPLFTLGGFLLYLHRRIELEAWDVELAFKTLLKRIRPALSSILLLFLLSVNVETPAFAEEQSLPHSVAGHSAEVTVVKLTAEQQLIASQIEHIYQTNQLIETDTRWQVKPVQEDDTASSAFWLDLLVLLGKSIAYLAWAAVIVIATLLLFWLYRNAEKLKLQQRTVDTAEHFAMPLFFADIPHQASVEQLLQLAAQCLDSTEYRRALACMLRASIMLVHQQFNVVLSANMTERECLAALQRQLPEHHSDVFQRLFNAWIVSAWAHQAVTDVELNSILTQLRQWQPMPELAK